MANRGHVKGIEQDGLFRESAVHVSTPVGVYAIRVCTICMYTICGRLSLRHPVWHKSKATMKITHVSSSYLSFLFRKITIIKHGLSLSLLMPVCRDYTSRESARTPYLIAIATYRHPSSKDFRTPLALLVPLHVSQLPVGLGRMVPCDSTQIYFDPSQPCAVSHKGYGVRITRALA